MNRSASATNVSPPQAIARHHSVIKSVGGKRQLLPEILRFVPDQIVGSFHEPFVGGGAVFFELAEQGRFDHSPTWISDANAKLIAMYTAVRDCVEDVIRHLQLHTNTEAHFYEVRKNNMMIGSITRRAADYIFLNRAGFNGLYRENSKGQFNVPFGDNPKAIICDEARLRLASEQLKTATIRHRDFEVACSDVRPGDLTYLDSPYAPLSKTSSFTKYSADDFKPDDHQRLAATARGLIANGVDVILSASSAPITYDLYAGLPIVEVEARRAVSSKASTRGPVKEVLIVSPWLYERAKERKA